ncbi:hypothetical protein MVEG_11190 [Podila verticillata NRRL 6337]|uniref:Uncharacterized protein n=1 Tax=Podila verticillata NRRL 6337 TaxID=1069443 RepID=A0A086TMH6_9FUNG|nr:hypothetical protein MVEG_11190 [Podila verticillata NRRL 6337]
MTRAGPRCHPPAHPMPPSTTTTRCHHSSASSAPVYPTSMPNAPPTPTRQHPSCSQPQGGSLLLVTISCSSSTNTKTQSIPRRRCHHRPIQACRSLQGTHPPVIQCTTLHSTVVPGLCRHQGTKITPKTISRAEPVTPDPSCLCSHTSRRTMGTLDASPPLLPFPFVLSLVFSSLSPCSSSLLFHILYCFPLHSFCSLRSF